MTTYSHILVHVRELRTCLQPLWRCMKIKSFYLYSKDFNTQKLYVLEIKKYFVNICEFKKNLANKKFQLM